MKLHIAEVDDFSATVLADMRDRFELTTGPVSDLKKTLDNVDVFWMRLGYVIDHKVLSEDSRCKIIATPVTGIDHIDEELCKKLGVKIICLREEKEFLREVRATAEHSILLAMMLMRQSADAVLHTRNGNWNRDLFRGSEIYKKKVGILGLGRLGSIVAEYYKALGCEIYYYDIKDVDTPVKYNRLNSAQKIVQMTDIISIHIPYNRHTHHIYGQEFFAAFDNTKWIINTSRGGVINEKYLLEALESDNIAGAALDVLEGEPDIEDHPLIDYAQRNSNLIITPHIGGNTIESFAKTERFIADQILKTVNLARHR